MPTDPKEAEKEYLRRAAAGDWELAKPFASPNNQVSAEEAAAMIHDFAVLLRLLDPGPGDRILDLAAGACWVTDWLLRLNLHVTSVDIAFDMLQLGRKRLPSPDSGRLVTGDLESLPFAPGSFDLACCMSAIHHVPSIPTALGEICRVLAPNGRAVFLEPGARHASTDQSQTMMRDFGVLEQDIVVSDFMRQCSEAGFEHVEVISLAYVLPDTGVTRDRWQNWRRRARTKRPVRAAGKMWRDLLEFFGLGKGDLLFEEAWSVQLARVLGESMEDHPVFVAHRSKPDQRRALAEHGSAIQVQSAPETAVAGRPMRIEVRVRNTGSLAWRAWADRQAPTRVGLQLLAGDGRLLNRDFARASLPHDVMPGTRCDVAIECLAPPAGSYQMKLDMVTENVTWFELKGSPTVTIPLTVRQ